MSTSIGVVALLLGLFLNKYALSYLWGPSDAIASNLFVLAIRLGLISLGLYLIRKNLSDEEEHVAEDTQSGWIVIGLALVPLVIGFVLVSSMLNDDAYITFWPAHTLAETGEIVNYNGDRVEQSSSLGFVVLLAALVSLIPAPIPTLAPLVSGVFAVATVLLTLRLAAKLNPTLTVYAGMLAASAVCLVAWAFSGMETTFHAFSAVWLLLAYARFLDGDLTGPVILSACSATLIYVIARPESVFIALGLHVGLIALLCLRLIAGKDSGREQTLSALRRTGFLLMLVVLVAIALGVFRQAYFGDWFPQPVVAKVVGPSLKSAVVGWKYMMLSAWTGYNSAVWILAILGIGLGLLGAVREGRFCPTRVLVVLFAALGTAFIVMSGGDWMVGGRFLVPLLPASVIVALDVFQLVKPRALMKSLLCVTIFMQVFALGAFARNDSWGGPIWASGHVDARLLRSDSSWFEVRQRHAYHDVLLTTRLNEVIQELRGWKSSPITIMSGQMGQVAYHTTVDNYGHVRLIDRYALATRDFTDCRVTMANPKVSVGLIVSYPFFFENLEGIEEECGLRRPDIIWDWGGPDFLRRSVGEANGYITVYSQGGHVVNGSRWFPGRTVVGREFIAVRRDLFDPALMKPSYNFDGNQ